MADTAAPIPITLTVTSKLKVADDIFMFELRHPSGAEQLPPFTPGAHISIVTPSGQKRRYSLCNDSAERNRYVIAVKQEKTGRGGSLSFTKQVDQGDFVTIDQPANEFEMSAVDARTG